MDPLRADRLWAARVAGQSGLVTRAQAHLAGVSDGGIEWRLRTRRWVAVHPGVYQTTPGREDWETRAVAALLHVGAPSALCGPSAGFAWGLVESPGDEMHVVVPASRRATSGNGVTVTRTRAGLDRVHQTAWPHRVTIEHTVLDMSLGATLERAIALAARACQKKLTTPERLAAALECRPNQTHRLLLAEALTDVGELESIAELRYVRDVERAHGLPAGQRQTTAPGSGRRDSEYEEVAVIVEVDGRLAHEGWAGRRRDGRRDRDAARSGRLTVRVFWIEITQTPCDLASELADVFAIRGWQGSAHPCRKAGCRVGRRGVA